MIALGIDIGGTRIKAGRVDPSGAILDETSMPTPATIGDLRQCLEKLAERFAAFDAVGIGCKGIIDTATTRVTVLPGTLRFLEGHRLADFFPPGQPVFADNDARVAMAGEMAWGAARGRRNALLLTLGTGVGGAVLAEGMLLRGAAGIGGHLGHITVDPDGPDCICGNHGCLETVFSARAIEAEAIAAVLRGCASVLTERFSDRPAALTCRDVFDCAEAGDAVARRLVADRIRRLGAAVAGLVHLLDPELILVGGQIADAGAPLLQAIETEIAWRTAGLLRRRVPVVPTRVSDRSGIAGAAALVFYHQSRSPWHAPVEG